MILPIPASNARQHRVHLGYNGCGKPLNVRKYHNYFRFELKNMSVYKIPPVLGALV
jgi:hypothetical protein